MPIVGTSCRLAGTRPCAPSGRSIRQACAAGRRSLLAYLAIALLAAPGCQAPILRSQSPEPWGAASARDINVPYRDSVPTEKSKTSLPMYIVEPPDILLIDAIRLVPKAPYKLEPLDVVQLVVIGALQDQPISGQYSIDSDGTIDLGPSYGKVKIAGLTTDQARAAVVEKLRLIVRDPEVSLTLNQATGQQQIGGEHLVNPDGTLNLGVYGSVYVAGMTLDQVQAAVQEHLANYLEDPQVSVDVSAYNSKSYYIITEGAGRGDLVLRVPCTGNETVLEALAQVQGLSAAASKNIWIARPMPGGAGCDQILPVNWHEITKGAATASNYQILPRDRVFVAEDRMLTLAAFVERATGPFERMFGFGLLGAQTIQNMNRFPLGQQGRGF